MNYPTRVSRYDKKILRAIILCHTGNPMCRKAKYSRIQWLRIKAKYKIWFKAFKHSERKMANTIK